MEVLNKHKSGIPKGAVYIGRGSKWGNPFVIGKDGDRATVCAKHKEYLWQQIKAGEVTLADLMELQGKDLVCFCAPLQCHGDTLVQAVAWSSKQ